VLESIDAARESIRIDSKSFELAIVRSFVCSLAQKAGDSLLGDCSLALVSVKSCRSSLIFWPIDLLFTASSIRDCLQNHKFIKSDKMASVCEPQLSCRDPVPIIASTVRAGRGLHSLSEQRSAYLFTLTGAEQPMHRAADLLPWLSVPKALTL